MVVLVNDEWLFRFPKREAVAARLFNVEIPLLAILGPLLPLPIPHFEFVVPEPIGPAWPFAGYRLLPGEPLDNQSLEVKTAQWWRTPVADFLAALHSFSVVRAKELGVTPFRLVHAPAAATDWRSALEDFYTATRYQIYPLLSLSAQDSLAEQFEAFLDDERFFEFTPTLLHGDLSQEHVLLDVAGQRVTGILDFGDVGLGDPAYDVWPELVPFYPLATSDPTLAERSRFYQKLPPLHALMWAQEMADSALLEFGMYELRRLWQLG